LEAVEGFVTPQLERARESILTRIHDPKSQLQERVQAQRMTAPRYRTVSTTGPDHARVFEVDVEIAGQVAGRGRGTSKHLAEQDAAQDALHRLGMG